MINFEFIKVSKFKLSTNYRYLRLPINIICTDCTLYINTYKLVIIFIS